jgi:acyl-CoA synthetase (NDP forming)
MKIDALMTPRSIAVVGASPSPSPGRNIIETLGRLGFEGEIYPINPKYETVLGWPCYPSFEAIPARVDAAAFCIGYARVLKPFREAAAHGLGAAVIFDGGFAERGEEGRRLQAELVGIAAEAGIALCGPNCMGVLSPATRSALYLGALVEPQKLQGNVGFVAQSGSIVIGMLCDTRRFGFTHAVSSGNEAVVTAADYIDYLIDDPATKVIGYFCEFVAEPERFVASLDRAADAGKPVVVLKVGKSARSQRAIIGHTGGVAGETRVFSELLRRHRAIEVSAMDEMSEVLAACQSTRRPKGRNIGIVTASGGQAELILDIADAAGFTLPPLSPASRISVREVIGAPSGDGNPLDAWGNGDYQRNLRHGLEVMIGEPATDAVVLVSDTNDGQAMRPTQYTEILTATAAETTKPCYFINTRPGLLRLEHVERFRGTGVAPLGGLRQGLAAIDRLGGWAAPRPAPRAVSARPNRALDKLLSGAGAARPTIHEHDAKSALREAGVPVVEEHRVESLANARAAASALGYPVVFKVLSDEIAHKSEHGLVATALADEQALADTWTDFARRLRTMSLATAPSFLVQPLVTGGQELFAGVTRDPQFGPCLAFGAGGVLVELLDETALRLLPLREGDAEAMVAETRVKRLLDGFRGRPRADADALYRLLYAVAEFAWTERARVAEIDLNPIIVLPEGQGCLVVDALIVPAA